MSPASLVLPSLLGLVPVLAFLAALRWMDSYHLVRLRDVLAAVGCGAAMAGAAYAVNGWLISRLEIGLQTFAQAIAPLVEELLKSLFIVALIRRNRIGFLVDAAIFGFAVGTGFALVENLYYLYLVPGASMTTWTVRGLGTAVMHAGCTAIFAVVTQALLARNGGHLVRAGVPGLLIAVLVHATFNRLGSVPLVATLAVMVAVPLLLAWVFQRSESATREWLGEGFDSDLELLAAVNSGHVGETPVGRYLDTLRDRFQGPVRADLLCYLRLHCELALRAKGLLMMRENGFAGALDEATRSGLAELRFLERSIGRVGLLAVRPVLNASRQDVWQLALLERS